MPVEQEERKGGRRRRSAQLRAQGRALRLNTHAHTSARCVRFLARERPPSSNFYLLKLDNKASSDGGSVGRWVARLPPAFAALPELRWPRWGRGVRKTMMMTVRMKRLAPVKVLMVSRRGGSRKGRAPAFGSVPAAVVLLNSDNCAKSQAPPPNTPAPAPNTLNHAHHPPRIEVHVIRWRRRLSD